MAQFSSLPPHLKEYIVSLSNSGKGRTKLVSIAIAKAIADTYPLPTGNVGDIKSFFRNTMELDAMRLISNINELSIVDTTAILTYVRTFFIWRYRVAYDPHVVICNNPDTVVQDFFGIDAAIDQDATSLMKAEPVELMHHRANGGQLVKFLMAAGSQ